MDHGTPIRDARVRDRRSHVARHAVAHLRARSIRRAVSLSLIFLLVFSGTALALSVARFQGNIDQQDIGSLLGEDRPTARPAPTATPTGPVDSHEGEELNILLMGSDSREGANSAIDGSGASEGMRSDTTMIVHISADRSRIETVSIPRDTLVDIPECTLPDGTTTAEQYDVMFNSAFATGGATGDVGAAAACTILTVEQLTGLFIDDFVVVDFAGFVNVIDALGGVALYIPEDINDRAADLILEEGCRLLDGSQALGLARVRKTVGDGSDISRIGRQQDLVAAIIREVLSTNLLRSPVRLYQFLDSATQTLTTGQSIGDLSALVGLGSSLSSIRTDDVVFITMPFTWAGARVVPAEEYADLVWLALGEDTAVDSIYSGDSTAILVALQEREEAAAAPPVPTEAPTDPAIDENGAPEQPAEDPQMCTKATAS